MKYFNVKRSVKDCVCICLIISIYFSVFSVFNCNYTVKYLISSTLTIVFEYK